MTSLYSFHHLNESNDKGDGGLQYCYQGGCDLDSYIQSREYLAVDIRHLE